MTKALVEELRASDSHPGDIVGLLRKLAHHRWHELTDEMLLGMLIHAANKAADHIEAISSENERIRAVLTKAKAFHDLDSGCNGFTADYEILRLEIDEALAALLRSSTEEER